ncbi:MAG: glutathione S-transferase family protein [Thiohalomonadaceae bacterium]
MQRPELVSFVLCPFVQRSVIVLREKEIDFDITYIDLAAPPPWFRVISPMGKVPLLRVGEVVLFESAVIMEYLDETNPPSLQPADPLLRAKNRAWTEFASNLLGTQYRLSMARDEEEFERQRSALAADLARLEPHVRGPFFNGSGFALVDAAFAPFFQRLDLLEQWHALRLLDGLPNLQAWQQVLLSRPSLKKSVVEDFAQQLRDHIRRAGGYASRLFG